MKGLKFPDVNFLWFETDGTSQHRKAPLGEKPANSMKTWLHPKKDLIPLAQKEEEKKIDERIKGKRGAEIIRQEENEGESKMRRGGTRNKKKRKNERKK